MFGLKENTKPAISKKQAESIANQFENSIGIEFAEEACTRVGYLANVKPTTFLNEGTDTEYAALLCFFIDPSGKWTKAIYPYQPYFYLLCAEEATQEIVFYLNKTFEAILAAVDPVSKEDLGLVNHLSGKTESYLKLSFRNVQDLLTARSELMPLVRQNKAERETQQAYEGWYNQEEMVDKKSSANYLSKILDIREYDVPYHIRVQVDNELRCSYWYEFHLDGTTINKFVHLSDKLDKADLRIMAYDIETTKSPLKFPDVRFDQIMMISYIVDGNGFLITNREVVGEDVMDFEYAPTADYDVGVFTVFNEADEQALLKKFFAHIRETKPTIFVTFNGDSFDWPFVKERALTYKIVMEEEIGVFYDPQNGYIGRFASHMDCLYWVKRDAYLPQGSHGLKRVTKAKLGYDPVELDPELMVRYAKEKPQELAEYSVSDSVATYFLYLVQIHDFIFALCTIIPTYPDEVLRRGSGTLCEDLLMAQAFRGNIIFPNKQTSDPEKFHNGNFIDSETYIGGHVECLRTGVYRSDIPVKFRLEKAGYEFLEARVEETMDFALKIEMGVDKADVVNYDEIRDDILAKLSDIKGKCPVMETTPLIYHVDVAAMYPNIILSNRLQPVAIVNEKICAGCVFNKEENNCKRPLDWQWRGDMFPLNKREYEQIKMQLKTEEEDKPGGGISGNSLEFQAELKRRIKKYCQKAYRSTKKTQVELKTDTVCMRENPFYVDTVRDFRDRRYEFKRLVKVWWAKLSEAKEKGDSAEIEIAKNRMALYESLQLAHKIILNSFYGYVMRRGARWYSMEMAAMVTHTGGSIIMDSRSLFDQIGMPLELDTDGIWTLLPKGFPENYKFEMKNGKKLGFAYPCTMCNLLIYDKYGNKQYQTLVDQKTLTYETRLEMSVFFEIDGPYRCMLIPASKEENKMLKKRYAVFNDAGKMTEVKGFELKRRGELNIVKIFQGEVFSKFLEGSSLQECYDACGEIADRWYDILETHGEYVEDVELIDYIGEARVISKALHEYGVQKGTSLTCARRLAEVLGPEIVKDKGLNVKFIISKKPLTAKVADRAIPTAIFETSENIMKKFVRKWTGDAGLQDFDLRSLLDWDYYKERLGSTIQKIITIPAALQKCLNPCPRIEYPEWLHKRIKAQDDKFKQKDMRQFFKVADIEDLARQRSIPVPTEVKNRVDLREKQQSSSADQQPELNMDSCPDPDEDFGSWLKHQKSNWRNIRKKLKTDKGVIPHHKKMGAQSAALTNFMRNMDDTVLNSNWHILQIDQTFEAGILRVWAVTESGNMFNVKLAVPRTLYINSKTVSEEADFKKVQKTLPRNRKVYHLYEWETTEDNFQSKFNDIKYNHLMNQNVEGIYETKVPPKFRALMELGAIVRPRKKIISRQEQALGRTYKLNELELKAPGVNEHYLPSSVYEKIYLCHSNQGNRHFWGLFIEATHEITFFVVSPVNKQQANQNLKNLFASTLTELELDVDYAAWQVTGQHVTGDLQSCLKLIDRQLLEHKMKHKGATMAVLQSEMSSESLQFMGLPSLHNEFPVLKCAVIPSDNELPALDWIRFACRNMTIRFTDMGDWVQNRVGFSRYTFIPVCNLEVDAPIFITDLLLARSLNMQKHIIWYSDSAQPDLGGHEDQNYRIYFQEEMENPEAVQSGFYRNYTIEIDIQNLSMTTILQSEFLRELDDALHLEAHQSKSKHEQASVFDTDLDEFVTCAKAFKTLKDLMMHWVQDIYQNDEYADELMQHVYRWICSSTTSKLYDPLLHRLVHKLMKKTFFQMLLQFKQLGCNVVYGTFHKLFLQTKKTTFEEAESHINFVIKTIKENNLFAFINFNPVEYWRILLFKDYYNFGGIKESNPECVQFNWDIALHLPEAIRAKFKFTVAEYLHKVYKFNERRRVDAAMAFSEVEEPAHQQVTNLMDDADDFKKEGDHEFISKLISEYFASKLFQRVSEFYQRKGANNTNEAFYVSSDSEDDRELNADSADELNDQIGVVQTDYQKQQRLRERERRLKEMRKWEFPQRIGSHYPYQVPALEFTKMITKHVFGLDDAFSHQTASLRKNLLTLIHRKEFSQEVLEGHEPSLILVVPDVICEICQKSQDLDVCRDQDINEQVDNDQGERLVADWKCKNCEADLNKLSVEKRLIELLNRRIVTYQLQDLKCKNCKMVNNGLVGRNCACTGKFLQTIGNTPPEKLKNQNLLNQVTDIRLFVRLLRNFGNYHQMQMLKESANQMLTLMKVNQ